MVNFKLWTALVSLAPAIFAHPASTSNLATPGFGCKSDPSIQFLSDAAAFAKLEQTFDTSSDLFILGQSAISAPIVIQTYFHVVAQNKTLSGGYVPQAQLTAQLNVMNQGYNPYGISFVLAGTDYTINADWSLGRAEMAMTRALRKGDYKTLNLYFMTEIDEFYGWCYFPERTSPGANAYIRDGCSVLAGTVPGGSIPKLNRGKVAIHEIGHWFGLLHTFDGNSCTGKGDLIDDTPASASASVGCPVGRDSCPNQPGLDPIHNNMDYSIDDCRTGFTAGQRTRMINIYNTFRAHR